MKFDKLANPSLTREECRLLVLALDSYIRRINRDCIHDQMLAEGAGSRGAGDLERSIIARMQSRQAKKEAAKELREKMAEQIKETY
jgi:hypothetical protein